jgi:predicted transcriptional regulator of viral defense system
VASVDFYVKIEMYRGFADRRRLVEESVRPQERIVLEMAQRIGVFRPADVERLGVSRAALTGMVRSGLLERNGRGLYSLPEYPWTEHHTLAEACKRVPKGVVCLLSALNFHDMGTQTPSQIWMAIDQKAYPPKADRPKLKIVRFSGDALAAGIQEHQVEGVTVRVYGPAKTVADCFKCRSKIGLDVALEALQDYLRGRLGTVDELMAFAKVCRVENVMRPYVQALTA